MSGLADQIVVLDNGSSDGTFLRYANYPKVSKILKTEGYHEGRDKVMLLEEARKLKPDWVIWTDADEVFEKNLTRETLDYYMNGKFDRVTFRMCNFWLDRVHCRYDSNYLLYTVHPQRSMWRNADSAFFKNW